MSGTSCTFVFYGMPAPGAKAVYFEQQASLVRFLRTATHVYPAIKAARNVFSADRRLHATAGCQF